ncbi:unnamed protein product [Didymodactylos carnosus]|uniref:TRPM-like domain-containing protein n=1 Tax=Didymodactylos carnosus TaxID=1234261 RepID=A0A8S2E949_9BILA|nr:unnamed protein product [Didymodactylos carnosus]CAF3944738.1 unnamed protein product [Didymodactylos carnosus]
MAAYISRYQPSFQTELIPSKIFLKALEKNLPTFVHYFIKIGLPVHQMFFKSGIPQQNQYDILLTELYNERIIYGDDGIRENPLANVIQTDEYLRKKKIESTAGLNQVLRLLVGDYMKNLYSVPLADNVEPTTGNNAVHVTVPAEQHNETQLAIDTIYRDLFLWTIFNDYIDMAKFYRQIEPYNNTKETFLQEANYFKQYANDCLAPCHENEPKKADELTIRQIDLFGGVTCLQVAVDADDKRFVAQSCCVQAMTNIWCDKMHLDQTKKRSKLALLLGFLSLGLLAPAMVRFRELCKVLSNTFGNPLSL